MKNKKTLHLAIALAISSMPLFGVAEAARGSMYGGESVGDDVTIEASANAYPSLVGHAFGIYTNVTNSATVTSAGNRLTITTTGEAGDGIRSNPSGNSDWQNATGTINIGNDLTITVSGNSADGLNINGSTVLNIGDNATINTLYNGELKYSNGDTSDGAHAVRANFHATINIGDGLTAGTLGESSHAVYAAQGRSTTNPTGGSKINIGKGAVLSTAGDGSHTVMMASNNGNVIAFNVIFISGESNIFLRKELGFSSLYTKSLLIVPLDAHTTRRISLIGISTLPFEITPFLMVISCLPIKEESSGN